MEELFVDFVSALIAVMLVSIVALASVTIYKASLHDDLTAYGKVVVELEDTPVECVKK